MKFRQKVYLTSHILTLNYSTLIFESRDTIPAAAVADHYVQTLKSSSKIQFTRELPWASKVKITNNTMLNGLYSQNGMAKKSGGHAICHCLVLQMAMINKISSNYHSCGHSCTYIQLQWTCCCYANIYCDTKTTLKSFRSGNKTDLTSKYLI